MRQKTFHDEVKRGHDVDEEEHSYKANGICQQIARHAYFENCTLAVILLNLICLSFDAEHNDAALLINADWTFIVLDNFFCTFFVFESVVRYLAFENKIDAFCNVQFAFDSALAFLMVLEVWILTVMDTLRGQN